MVVLVNEQGIEQDLAPYQARLAVPIGVQSRIRVQIRSEEERLNSRDDLPDHENSLHVPYGGCTDWCKFGEVWSRVKEFLTDYAYAQNVLDEPYNPAARSLDQLVSASRVSLERINEEFRKSYNTKWSNFGGEYMYVVEKMIRAGAPIELSKEWMDYFQNGIQCESDAILSQTPSHMFAYNLVKSLSRCPGVGLNSGDIPAPVREKVEHWLAKGIYGMSGKRFDFALAAAAKRAGLALPPIPIMELDEKIRVYIEQTDSEGSRDKFIREVGGPPRSNEELQQCLDAKYLPVLHHLRRVLDVFPASWQGSRD